MNVKKAIEELTKAGAYRIEVIYLEGNLDSLKVYKKGLFLNGNILAKLFPGATVSENMINDNDEPGHKKTAECIEFEYNIKF